MSWELVEHPEVEAWIRGLDLEDRDRVIVALDKLIELGPALGRPFADTIKGSRYRNMKELRPRGGNLRLLYAFDPLRQAILLVGGDKSGQWNRWYEKAIPIADDRFARHVAELRGETR